MKVHVQRHVRQVKSMWRICGCTRSGMKHPHAQRTGVTWECCSAAAAALPQGVTVPARFGCSAFTEHLHEQSRSEFQTKRFCRAGVYSQTWICVQKGNSMRQLGSDTQPPHRRRVKALAQWPECLALLAFPGA